MSADFNICFKTPSRLHYIALFRQSSLQMINKTVSIGSAVSTPSAVNSLRLVVVTERELMLGHSHCQSQ